MADADAALARYRAKRDFSVTSEPEAGGAPSAEALTFVVQKHWATRLHYDFRLELDGTMLSWAVPKGPSLDPRDKRMAVHVEDHPISYAGFEGTIPENQYGAGKVIVWDKGTWAPIGDPRQGLRDGNLKFEIQGHKLQGRWVLVRMKGRGEKQEAWLLIKEKDEFVRTAAEFSVVDERPDSVKALPMPKAPTASHGLRAEAPASALARERPSRPAKARAPAVAASPAPQPLSPKLRVTHPERVIDPSTGVTKIDLVRYYGLVGDLMMSHLKGRPVSLVRAPAGVTGQLFFQKHAETDKLPGVRQLDPALDPGHPPMLEIASAKGLLAVAQWNVVEVHTLNAGTRAFEHPDRMVFDLDPGEGVQWPQVREAAELVHAFLTQLGLASFLKTSGGKGLHVVVPVRKVHDWDTVKGFSQAVVAHLSSTLADRFVAKSGPKNRIGRIFIDYLRNGQGATTVCAWSARAREGLGISVPVRWDELSRLDSGAHWTVRSVQDRLAEGNRPWEGYARAGKSLAAAIKTIGWKPAATKSR